jgi:hypothetical protein
MGNAYQLFFVVGIIHILLILCVTFSEVYGNDANGGSPRVDQGESGRWRRWTREDIAKRGENLDIIWLRDESLQSGDDLFDLHQSFP